jgi:hypothetical protein
MALGWECPRCHRCYAPSVKKCKECKPIQVARPVWYWPYIPYTPILSYTPTWIGYSDGTGSISTTTTTGSTYTWNDADGVVHTIGALGE